MDDAKIGWVVPSEGTAYYMRQHEVRPYRDHAGLWQSQESMAEGGGLVLRPGLNLFWVRDEAESLVLRNIDVALQEANENVAALVHRRSHPELTGEEFYRLWTTGEDVG